LLFPLSIPTIRAMTDSTAVENGYSMKEICLETGLSEDTLRYYERDGLLSEVRRLPNGHRRFSTHDLEWLKFVICLRSTGMPLKKIRKYRELMMEGDRTASERKELLICQKENILREIRTMNEALERLDYKIEYYRQIEETL